MMTVSDMVSLDTPPKNEAAPISAMAPGSIHPQRGLSLKTPNIFTMARPIIRPYIAPISLQYKTSCILFPESNYKYVYSKQ